jgi:hypothetical protein
MTRKFYILEIPFQTYKMDTQVKCYDQVKKDIILGFRGVKHEDLMGTPPICTLEELMGTP